MQTDTEQAAFERGFIWGIVATTGWWLVTYFVVRELI
jgi:hypothetical protein